jgi:hypothetical protein
MNANNPLVDHRVARGVARQIAPLASALSDNVVESVALLSGGSFAGGQAAPGRQHVGNA